MPYLHKIECPLCERTVKAYSPDIEGADMTIDLECKCPHCKGVLTFRRLTHAKVNQEHIPESAVEAR